MDELPSEFLPNRKLDVLNLGGNNITGNYPEAFSTLPSLREVVLELNPHLGGRIPESYCDLDELCKFNVDTSDWMFIVWVQFSYCQCLKVFLSIFSTGVVGDMPPCLCDKVGEGTLFVEVFCVKDEFVCDCCFGEDPTDPLEVDPLCLYWCSWLLFTTWQKRTSLT